MMAFCSVMILESPSNLTTQRVYERIHDFLLDKESFKVEPKQ